VFDWDGTLMDSINHIVDALQHAMHETGVEVLERQRSKDIIGLGMREAIVALFPDSSNDESFIQQYAQHYKEYYHEPGRVTELYEGARELLQNLKSDGYTLAIATGKGRPGLNRVLQQTGLGYLFEVSRCADETQSKPHPAMIEEILKETNYAADQAIMIGDTEYDLEMASKANVKSIGASYGVHDEARLLKHKPIGIIKNIIELSHLLKKV